ncbi:hypothetical protein LCGC14_0861770 [marine sediment metagenome]|uniref:Uncharacterized protein n=1 Tax=marine sediment metagenome TaxID=412755 RepID=A0A0F9RRT5_9ZZZZ
MNKVLKRIKKDKTGGIMLAIVLLANGVNLATDSITVTIICTTIIIACFIIILIRWLRSDEKECADRDIPWNTPEARKIISESNPSENEEGR